MNYYMCYIIAWWTSKTERMVHRTRGNVRIAPPRSSKQSFQHFQQSGNKAFVFNRQGPLQPRLVSQRSSWFAFFHHLFVTFSLYGWVRGLFQLSILQPLFAGLIILIIAPFLSNSFSCLCDYKHSYLYSILLRQYCYYISSPLCDSERLQGSRIANLKRQLPLSGFPTSRGLLTSNLSSTFKPT